MKRTVHESLFSVFIFVLPLFYFSCKGQGGQQDIHHEFTNDLIRETSPYLLQHAHNPVNWRPWSQQAFDDAEKENKLVLVSIGYSSCHWCHVMEEETFEDSEVAELMNDNYVSIKVDREERPDVDHIYQTAIQLVKGNGGWPLNAIVLPNGKPLYLGTYHTKEQWNQVLDKMNSLYHDNPAKAEEYAEMLSQGIQEVNVIPSANDQALSKSLVEQSVENWKPNWDSEWGGDKQVQKFMIPVNLNFLIDYATLAEDESIKAHVRNTLDKIAMGGVHDQIGGGFFRYSTDARWKVPHFEKMLYDNAQALSIYAKAYQVFKDPQYKNVILHIVTFLKREMQHPEGGYYAALDADSEGVEGKYYVWEEEELRSRLKEDFELFSKYYEIRKERVWEDGNYVLHRLTDDETFSVQNNLSKDDLEVRKTAWRAKLLKARKKRVRPRTDDKIITSWNALLINGYIDAYKALGKPEFLQQAEAIFQFVQQKRLKDGLLVHTYKKGSRRSDGFLEDYAFLMDATLNLYGITLDENYLDFAKTLNVEIKHKFSDDASEMYRFNADQDLISTIIKTDDGAIPSPNAVMAHNLYRLGHILYDIQFIEKSKKMLSSMWPMIELSASSYAKWNSLALHHTYPYYEIAVVGSNAEALIKDLHQNYIPNTLVVGSNEESDLPLFKNRYDDTDTYIYVCQNSTCKLPVETVKEALEQLNNF